MVLNFDHDNNEGFKSNDTYFLETDSSKQKSETVTGEPVSDLYQILERKVRLRASDTKISRDSDSSAVQSRAA